MKELVAMIEASGFTFTPTLLIGIMGTIITGMITYLIARRQTSGKASTASANIIFEAAETIRKEQRDEIISLKAEVLALKKEMVALREEAMTMRDEMVVLRKESILRHRENM